MVSLLLSALVNKIVSELAPGGPERNDRGMLSSTRWKIRWQREPRRRAFRGGAREALSHRLSHRLSRGVSHEVSHQVSHLPRRGWGHQPPSACDHAASSRE